MEEARAHAIVTGRVQGVGFRYFALRQAQELSLRGWVRNLANGNVELMVQGPRERVSEFLQRIRKGPTMSWVQNCEVTWGKPDANFGSFELRSTSY